MLTKTSIFNAISLLCCHYYSLHVTEDCNRMVSVWIIIGTIALFTWILWRLHFTKTRNVIDKLPGPPSLPIIGNLLDFAFLDQEGFMDMYVNYPKKYQPVYRTWLLNTPMVHVSNPRHAELFLSNTQNIKKNYRYDFLRIWLGDGLLISKGGKWHSRRKLLTPAFHFSILEQFVLVFSEKSRILVEKLQTVATANPNGVDIVPYVTMCALDIICETAMGTPINAQNDKKSPYVSAIHEINILMMYRMLRPFIPDWIFNLMPAGLKMRNCLKTLHNFSNKVIQERRVELKNKLEDTSSDEMSMGRKKRTAFLDLLISMSEKDSTFSDDDIREEVDTFMFEGHDTTAMAMSWALYFIGTYPEIQAKCVEELESIFQGSERDPTTNDLLGMNYMERVIKETLRLRPSVYTIGRTLDHTVNMDGHELPPGIAVQIDIYNVHHNPEYFPEPEKFDPDRFLPDNCVDRHPFAYIPFSAGPRNCIGQRFALLEEKAVISALLRKFEIRATRPDQDGSPLPDLILRPLHGIKLKLLIKY